MGFLSSAYNWLHDKLNTGLLASASPSSVSLNSSPSHTSSTIKMDLDKPDPIKVYNPVVSALVPGVDPDAGSVLNDPEPNNPSPKSYKPSAYGLSSLNVAEIDYINAALAKHYGMDKSTAYQEALSNTSYQRAVDDMKAAGLNPAVLFSSGRGQSASSSIYASEASSGSGGGYGRRSSSSDDNGKLFSGSVYSAIQAIGGLIGVAVTKKPDGFWVGSQTAKGAMGLMDAVSKK